MKYLIDYYNENYTRKKKYYCKDVKAVNFISNEEFYKKGYFKKGGFHESDYINFPIYKLDDTIHNEQFLQISFTYEGKDFLFELEKIDKGSTPNNYIYAEKDTGNFDLWILGKELIIVIHSIDYPFFEEGVSITLSSLSYGLPKLEYPKNLIEEVRTLKYMKALGSSTADDYLLKGLSFYYVDNLFQRVKSIDEIYEVFTFAVQVESHNIYYIDKNCDNYYTVLDAIKKGRILLDYNDIECYKEWKIDMSKKIIYIYNFGIFDEEGFREEES